MPPRNEMDQGAEMAREVGLDGEQGRASTVMSSPMTIPVRQIEVEREKREDPRSNKPPAMKLPPELIQKIYRSMSPEDFNASRHTCRSWLQASLNEDLLQSMAERSGRRGSLTAILKARESALGQPESSWTEAISRLIARECNLVRQDKSPFVQIGHTDFDGLAPSFDPDLMSDEVKFTVSVCGRFLMAACRFTVYLFELNHRCSKTRPAQTRDPASRPRIPLGMTRPVSKVRCPRRVLACSMDTSAGRYAAAFLMEGRLGMVCDIMAERKGSSTPSSTSGSNSTSGSTSCSSSPGWCICDERPPERGPPMEVGGRKLCRNLGTPDDPPLSVAICPQQNCVAFGCATGVELHWVDAPTGSDLKKTFPLTSPSDVLYFLALRDGIDHPRKLRLISSAAGVPFVPAPRECPFGAFGTIMTGPRAAAMFPNMNDYPLFPERNLCCVAASPSMRYGFRESFLSTNVPVDSPLRRLAFSRVDHFRAVPLSDGEHVLFLDPGRGRLCLGRDEPMPSRTRLRHMVSFRAPPNAISSVPVLFAAGRDIRHGVRVVATFLVSNLKYMMLESATNSGAGTTGSSRSSSSSSIYRCSSHYCSSNWDSSNRGRNIMDDESLTQIIMFYTVPPDTIYNTTEPESPESQDTAAEGANGRTSGPNGGPVGFVGPRLGRTQKEIPEIRGSEVAVANKLTKIGLDTSPDLTIWAFSKEGWAKTWAVDTGRKEVVVESAVQEDGSVRRVETERGQRAKPRRVPPRDPSPSNAFDGSFSPDDSDYDHKSDLEGISTELWGLMGLGGRLGVTSLPRRRRRDTMSRHSGRQVFRTETVREVSGIAMMEVTVKNIGGEEEEEEETGEVS